MSEISAKPESTTVNMKMKIPTPEGVITLEELINKEVQKRIEEIRKRRPVGQRKKAMKMFCDLLFKRGSIAYSRKELRELAEQVKKQVGIRFGYSLLLRDRWRLVLPVEKEVEDKMTNRKFRVKFYVLSPKRYEEVFGEKLAPPEAKPEVTEEKPTETPAEAPKTEEVEEIEEEIEKEIEK